MKVEINGKTYCVETLIADNERLRKDVIASADTIRLVLDKIRAAIKTERDKYICASGIYQAFNETIKIIDKYRNEVNE